MNTGADMKLTARQVANLANIVGFNVNIEELGEEMQDTEILIAVGDEGEKVAFYNEQPNEGGIGLGD